MGDDKVNLKLAGHELFSKYTSFKTRALIGLCLGCFVLRGGCDGVGEAKLNNELQKNNEENLHVDDQIIKFVCSKLSTVPKVIEVCVQAIMYEPVDETKQICGHHDKFTYLHDHPTKVHHHMRDFTHPNDK